MLPEEAFLATLGHSGPNSLDFAEIREYVAQNIGRFHAKKIESLEKLKLREVLKAKNPYLFKAKNILTAEALIQSILEAFLSSQEETFFGEFIEGVAIFVCHQVYGGIKPVLASLEGIDLVFRREELLYLVEIKSGPNWGNSSQLKKMQQNFALAQQSLQAFFPGTIQAVNGCCYGRDKRPQKSYQLPNDPTPRFYWKYCGQTFWQFISGEPELYAQLIEPLGYQAKEKNAHFAEEYARLVNLWTAEFAFEFCHDGRIDWERWLQLVSASQPVPSVQRRAGLTAAKFLARLN